MFFLSFASISKEKNKGVTELDVTTVFGSHYILCLFYLAWPRQTSKNTNN